MPKGALVVVIAAALFGAAALWQLQPSERTERAAPLQVEPRPTPQDPAPSASEAAAPAMTPSASHPAVSAHQARMDFHNRVRTFFAQAPALSSSERIAQAQILDADIERYREAGEISAAEAFTLRAGLIRESAPADEQQARMEALREEYLARSASAGAAAPDPMFELYKAREREIVAQVQALETIPDGLSRDEYLRQVLQKERETLFGN